MQLSIEAKALSCMATHGTAALNYVLGSTWMILKALLPLDTVESLLKTNANEVRFIDIFLCV